MLKKIFYLFFLVSAINVSQCFIHQKNSCYNLEDYKTIQNNPNCFYNPDVGASVPEIITRYGFPFEVYKLTSEDGYILGLFRIPHNGTNINEKRQPILLHHSIVVDSTSWLILGVKSLRKITYDINNSFSVLKVNFTAFELSRNGFDVWLVNARGSLYSSEHVKFSLNEQNYWDFSFHEMALYDLPMIIDFIAAKTRQKGEINYIGHSMGATISYIYSSLKPRHARNNLKNIISFAPIAFLGHMKGILPLFVPLFKMIADILRSVGIHGIGKNFEWLTKIVQKLCVQFPFMSICAVFSSMISGINFNEILPEQFAVALSSSLAGVSLKCVEHYAQISLSKTRFQFFDYGFKKNLFLYKSSIPPEYPIERINVPVFLLYGKSDLLSVEEDVLVLYSKLKNKKNITEVFSFDHNDFVVGKHAPDLYKLVIDYLR